jgi:eukaryotic-like serine/threonine-protein kinase
VSEKSPETVGQYVVYEMLGKGGMATVHRAETQGMAGFRRPVALKRLHPYLVTDSDLVQAFIHEASHLRHTNCAQTYDLGKVDDTYFIAMEYVPGATVSQIIKQCNAAAGLMPIPVVVNVLLQVLDGLDHAHNLADDMGKPLGIVHRDVSPSNIIVSNTGVVKLIDFGIAKAEGSGFRTQTGLIKGKFGYVAPEYTVGQLDCRCDLFAVGVIAHEMLTGRRLFDGKDNFDTLDMLRNAPLQPPSRWRSDVPQEFDDIVMTALQREPSTRWQSASAMRVALGNFARDAKLELTTQQVKEWVEWAFTREPIKDDTGLVRVIQTLDEPSTGTKEISIEEFEELDAEAKTTIRPSAMYSAQSSPEAATVIGKAMLAARAKAKTTTKMKSQSRTWLWIIFALAFAAGGAWVALDHYGYEIDWSVFG